jgi:hypothetical protein
MNCKMCGKWFNITCNCGSSNSIIRDTYAKDLYYCTKCHTRYPKDLCQRCIKLGEMIK